jgi:predicted phosphodiesterase
MKIAILGDIHGNLEALKAAHAEAVSKGVDKVYHVGDVGGYAPFVNEVVAFLIEHGIKGVQGNYDETVANDREHCGCKYEDPFQAEMAALGFKWTKDHASPKSKDYMKNLPLEIRLIVDGKKIIISTCRAGRLRQVPLTGTVSSPCATPVLAVILAYVSTQKDILYGGSLPLCLCNRPLRANIYRRAFRGTHREHYQFERSGEFLSLKSGSCRKRRDSRGP